MRRSTIWRCCAVMLVASVVYCWLPTRHQPALAPTSAIAEESGRRPGMLWNDVSSNANFEVFRTKVPGGWFVHVRDRSGLPRDENRSVGGAFFYPDAEYKWTGTSQPR